MPMENDYEYFVRDCYTGIITITGTPIALIYSEGLKCGQMPQSALGSASLASKHISSNSTRQDPR
ncbi:hypothetical protein GQ600_6091 [Phytophthora cactorum]|nr:hypothetical protein GQ600_6091 [Phytophthora cactorum]